MKPERSIADVYEALKPLVVAGAPEYQGEVCGVTWRVQRYLCGESDRAMGVMPGGTDLWEFHTHPSEKSAALYPSAEDICHVLLGGGVTHRGSLVFTHGGVLAISLSEKMLALDNFQRALIARHLYCELQVAKDYSGLVRLCAAAGVQIECLHGAPPSGRIENLYGADGEEWLAGLNEWIAAEVLTVSH